MSSVTTLFSNQNDLTISKKKTIFKNILFILKENYSVLFKLLNYFILKPNKLAHFNQNVLKELPT